MAIQDLVISSKDLLEETVEQVVRKHFKYNDKGDVLIVTRKFWKLNGEEKILRYLAAVSGRRFLDIKNLETGLTNAQISKGLNMKNNSVRAHLSQLRARGLIETEKGITSITTQGLHNLLEEKSNQHS